MPFDTELPYRRAAHSSTILIQIVCTVLKTLLESEGLFCRFWTFLDKTHFRYRKCHKAFKFKFNYYGKYLQLNCVIANDLPVQIKMDLIKSQNYIGQNTVIVPAFSLILMSQVRR